MGRRSRSASPTPSREAQPALLRTRFTIARPRRPRAPVLDRARCRRARAQRLRRLGRRALARVDELPRSPRARDRRCDGARCAKARTCSARRSPAPGTPRSSASSTSPNRLYGTQPSFLAQLRVDVRRRRHGDTRRDRRRLARVAATARSSTAESTPGEHQDLRRSTGGRLVGTPGSTTPPGLPVRVGAAALAGYENVPVPEARIAAPVRRIQTLAVADVIDTPSGGADPRLRPEPRRSPARAGARRARPAGRDPACRGAGRRRARHPTPSKRQGDGDVRPFRRRRRPRVPVHVLRIPVCRDHWRRRRRRGRRGGRAAHRHDAHRLVRVIRTRSSPAARERRLGNARQLPVDPDRLPAARRAARLDRRHPGLLAHGELPVRLRRLPHLMAPRPRPRAGPQRRRGSPRHPRGPALVRQPRPTAAWGDAATAVPTVLHARFGDVGVLEAQYRQHAGLGRRRAAGCRPPRTVGRPHAARRLARSRRAARQARPGQGGRRHRRDGLPRPVAPPGRRRRRAARLRRRCRDVWRLCRAQSRRVRRRTT